MQTIFHNRTGPSILHLKAVFFRPLRCDALNGSRQRADLRPVSIQSARMFPKASWYSLSPWVSLSAKSSFCRPFSAIFERAPSVLSHKLRPGLVQTANRGARDMIQPKTARRGDPVSLQRIKQTRTCVLPFQLLESPKLVVTSQRRSLRTCVKWFND